MKHESSPSIADAIGRYESDMLADGLVPRYVEQVCAKVRTAARRFKWIHPGSVTVEDVRQGVAEIREQGNSNQTVKQWLNAVKVCCKHWSALGWRTGNPVEAVRFNAPDDRHPQRAFAVDEVRKLAKHPARGNAYLFLALTGLRKSEMNDSCWGYVDGDVLKLPGAVTKSGRDEAIPLVPEALAAMGGPETQANLALFPVVDGRTLKKDCVEVGVDPVNAGLHCFRRGLATMLRANGVGAEDMRQILRHSSFDTTVRHYVKETAQQVAPHLQTVAGELV